MSKVAKLDDDSEENELPEEITSQLEEIAAELETVSEEYAKREREITQEFEAKKEPIFKRRSEILKSVPDFWAKCFANHPVLRTLAVEKEQDAIKYLDSLECAASAAGDDVVTLTLSFKENPYFTNTCLKKTVTEDEAGNYKSESTEIDWKPGKCLIKEGADDDKDGKKRGAISLTGPSLFEWFSSEDPGELMGVFQDLFQDPVEAYLGQLSDDLDFDDEEDDDEDEEDEEEMA